MSIDHALHWDDPAKDLQSDITLGKQRRVHIDYAQVQVQDVSGPGVESGEIVLVRDYDSPTPGNMHSVPLQLLTDNPAGPPYIVIAQRRLIRRDLLRSDVPIEQSSTCQWGAVGRATATHFHAHGQGGDHALDYPSESCPVGKNATLFGRRSAVQKHPANNTIFGGQHHIDRQTRLIEDGCVTRMHLHGAMMAVGGLVGNKHEFSHAVDVTEQSIGLEETLFRRVGYDEEQNYITFDFRDTPEYVQL